jgi:hypothetical protein
VFIFCHPCFWLQIYDKTEALLHQRLITRMLAEKTRELEAMLARFTDSDDVFTESLQEDEKE